MKITKGKTYMVHDNLTMARQEEETTRDNKRASSQMQEDLQEAMKCPRCNSINTKFCYYNNYSLTQPRHFCKTCRRYWTQGGALRNVPIGGGTRKSKKLKSSSSNSSNNNSTCSDNLGVLKLFHGLPSSPAMDFQLGGLSLPMLNLNSPPSNDIVYNQFSSSFGDIFGSSSIITSPNNCFNLDQSLGLNFSFPPLIKQQSEMAYVPSHASFLEHHQQIQRPQPLLFQNLDVPSRENEGVYGNNGRKEGLSGNIATGYLFEEIYAPTFAQTTSRIALEGANNEDQNGGNWNNEFQAWENMDHFNAIP